jgi:regulator of protease activity HflC (stomatin/prohibitin superfamily)
VLAMLLGIVAITVLFFSVVIIESGTVGVKKTLGKVQPEEVKPGLSFKLPGITTVTEYAGGDPRRRYRQGQ